MSGVIVIVPETPDQLRERDKILFRSLHQYDRATHDPRHYSGTILIDNVEICQTLKCAHCSAHFLNVKIPGRERGWCARCNAPVCPKKACDNCTPFERVLEAMEKHLPLDQLPIRVAVHGLLPGKGGG